MVAILEGQSFFRALPYPGPMILSSNPARSAWTLPQVLTALDSPTTARVLDQVQLGSFQAERIFSARNSLSLAALATAAYSTPEDQHRHLDRQTAVEAVHYLHSPDKGANLTTVQLPQALLVAVRGTAPPWINNHGQENAWSWKDLQADLHAVPVANHAGNALVHAGFKAQADSIWSQLKPLLQQAIATQRAIHFTGHSLGAAVALQLADRMSQELGQLPQSVLRLGGPEVGWSDHRQHLERTGLANRTVNVENCGDPICNILPGGETAGPTLYFDRNGEARLEGGSHHLDQLLGHLQDMRQGYAAIPLFRHFPQHYLEGLSASHNQACLKQLEEHFNPSL